MHGYKVFIIQASYGKKKYSGSYFSEMIKESNKKDNLWCKIVAGKMKQHSNKKKKLNPFDLGSWDIFLQTGRA